MLGKLYQFLSMGQGWSLFKSESNVASALNLSRGIGRGEVVLHLGQVHTSLKEWSQKKDLICISVARKSSSDWITEAPSLTKADAGPVFNYNKG